MAFATTHWLQRWRTALSDAPARQRLDALLSSPDAPALVRVVPAQDLYLLVREVGLADAAELVGMCSGEQLQAFVDLDAWHGDRLDPGGVARWLDALVAGRCRDLPELWQALDPPLQVLTVHRLVHVQTLDRDEPPPEPTGVFLMDTPDRRYRLSAVSEAVVGAARALLAAQLSLEPISVSVLAAEAAAAVPAECEELAFRFRSGRLADLGFPDPDEALLLETPYASLEHARQAASAVAVTTADTDLPRWLVVRGGGGLLAEALDLLEPDARARAGQELVHLCNVALVGWRVELGEPGEVRAAAEQVHAHVTLALRALGADTPETAAACLERTPARILYRTARTVLHGPGARAAGLLPIAGRLLPEDERFLEALASRPPRRLDGAPWSRPDQVHDAEARLAGLAWVAGWLRELPEDVSALDAFGTGLIRRVLGLSPGWEPVGEADLRAVLHDALRDGHLDEPARVKAEADAPSAAARAVARRLCDALAEEWGGLDADGPLDVRFVAGVRLRSPKNGRA